ncbi:hypothetical protein BT96DRAFT_949556 [Gymnopus androsaceus JB14]|uniref:Uncharacterized protein n=1 Tax=Gymnopus androsaceus JB14 TaxID=1447944 RepID=A0A6A4GJI0_9AGAR|nr:hypothetical protein BT96DRAFT_949556 [Gymnopus androsaceus JB14]
MESPTTPALKKLPEKTQLKLLYICTYLKHLPKSLPKPQKGEIPKYPFGTFRIDRDLLDHTGDHVGAINETFKCIFGWQTRTTGDGFAQGYVSVNVNILLLTMLMMAYSDAYVDLHNEEDYPEPELFNPSRFLDAEGKLNPTLKILRLQHSGLEGMLAPANTLQSHRYGLRLHPFWLATQSSQSSTRMGNQSSRKGSGIRGQRYSATHFRLNAASSRVRKTWKLGLNWP